MVKNLEKRLRVAKGCWADKLPKILWAYPTTPHIAIGETPFSLVYGLEAVIPAELAVQAIHMINYSEDQNVNKRLIDLNMLVAMRENVHAKNLAYKSTFMRAQGKRVRSWVIQIGDLVLRKAEVSKPLGKLQPKWEGPFKVIEARMNGSCTLETLDVRLLVRPWNVENLQKYYA